MGSPFLVGGVAASCSCVTHASGQAATSRCPCWELTPAQHEQLSGILCWCQANESLFSLLYICVCLRIVSKAAVVLNSTWNAVRANIVDAVIASQRKKRHVWPAMWSTKITSQVSGKCLFLALLASTSPDVPVKSLRCCSAVAGDVFWIKWTKSRVWGSRVSNTYGLSFSEYFQLKKKKYIA